MKKILVDFNKLGTIDEFHDFIEENLDLTNEYGRNLEALRQVSKKADCEFEVINGGPVLMEMQEIIYTILCNDANK